MKWIKWLQEKNETLLDLVFGCIVYSLVFELAGLLLVQNKGSYTLGLLLGTGIAIGMSISMYRGLDECLMMEPGKARWSMTIRSIIRTLVMLVAAWIGMRFRMFSFPGVIIGILGLKVSAHLHMYTNVYITKKIRRKGR